MKALDRILAVCDPAMTSSPALHRAIELARRAGAELHLCLFDYDAGIDVVEASVAARARSHFLGERLTWLEKQAADCAGHGVRVECDAIWSPALEDAIVAKTLAVEPDLVMKDLHTQSALARLVLLPRDWKLVRFCPAPLWLVSATTTALPERIVAGVDASEDRAEPSTLNAAVIEAALRVGLYSDAEVHVASTAPLIPTSGAYRDLAAAAAGAERAFKLAFDALGDRHQVPAERRHLLLGDPAASLEDLAKRAQAQLLVVGTHFRSGLKRLFLGSTAESLLNLTTHDVLLIKPAGVPEAIARHLGIAVR